MEDTARAEKVERGMAKEHQRAVVSEDGAEVGVQQVVQQQEGRCCCCCYCACVTSAMREESKGVK
jgi:hypothetical protein